MKTLKGRIVGSRIQSNTDEDGKIYIQLDDAISGCRAVTIKLSLPEFAEMVTGLMTGCEFDWNDNGPIGMQHEHKEALVPIPDRISATDEEYAALLKPFEVDGWRGSVRDARNHHNQIMRDGKRFARITLHRHVEVPDAD